MQGQRIPATQKVLYITRTRILDNVYFRKLKHWSASIAKMYNLGKGRRIVGWFVRVFPLTVKL
jgi:hypothetical protein